jgi:molybdopterin-guanine dinucleotide biosynthesis protein A
MTAFLEDVRVERVAVPADRWLWRGLAPFYNVNTPQDLAHFRNLVASS